MPAPETSSWPSIRRMHREAEGVRCETSREPILIPSFLGGHLRAGDEICAEPGTSSPVYEVLARRSLNGRRSRQLYFSRIGYVTQPKSDKRDQYFVRAEVAASKLGITSLHLPSSAIRDHFYFFAARAKTDRRLCTTCFGLRPRLRLPICGCATGSGAWNCRRPARAKNCARSSGPSIF
jgi:hypothetical protein